MIVVGLWSRMCLSARRMQLKSLSRWGSRLLMLVGMKLGLRMVVLVKRIMVVVVVVVMVIISDSR